MSSIITTLDNIQLKLSNLDKVLWPDDGITKAEIIQYYLAVWPYMEPLVKGRPLTLIRYPDGIHSNRFYSKNAPDHTPDWIPTIAMDDIKYIHIQKSADLVYAANLAALELHMMTVRAESMAYPDTIIFDLDPAEGQSFDEIKDICSKLYITLLEMGYNPHIKTSGSKGLHIYVPILPQYTREQVVNTAKTIGQTFVDSHPNTTLRISKERRVGKLLIDIYRNHNAQTCVGPLSTRAKPGATVSMPILFEHLHDLSSSGHYTIKTALPYLEQYQPWKDFERLRMPMNDPKIVISASITPDLKTYEAKRDFTKTTEPAPAPVSPSSSQRFVIQKHDASNLHYDLRLEENGVLTSWAIPKSLPTLPDIKRLAIRTEDHPIKYLDFEGVIPANEYGGGTMWVFDKGNYDVIKKSDKSYKIKLSGQHIKAEYSIFHTRDNHWIVELISGHFPIIDPQKIASPMLAEQITSIPSPSQYFFELKWDGIRTTIFKNGSKVYILSKSGRDITSQFPDIAEKIIDFDAEMAILDGELVCLDSRGVPVFANIISRMHSKGSHSIDMSMKANPAVLYLFDLRYIDGRSCISTPIEKRREWLAASTKISERIRISEAFDDGQALFDGAKALGLEGIMAKKKGSYYAENRRSPDWVKIKVRTIIDVVIIGYTKGNGDRSDLYGALHVAKRDDQRLTYMGKVGTGWDEAKMKEILNYLKACATTSKPIPDPVEEEYNTTWIEPLIECEVQYASLTPNGTLREPVFYRIKTTEE